MRAPPSSRPAGLHGHPRRRPRRGAGRRPPRARGAAPASGWRRAASRRTPPRCRSRPRQRRAASHVVRGGPTVQRRSSRRCPSRLLRTRPELQALPEVLERLGIRTLGELAALPSRAVAERFGHPGLLALDLSRGPRHPARAAPAVRAGGRAARPSRGGLGPAAGAGARAADRARARPARAARALAARARGVGALRGRRHLAHAPSRCATRAPTPRASGSRSAQKLAELPAPSESLALEVEAFGPPGARPGAAPGRGRRRCAARGWARRSARRARRPGPDAALRVLDVDPDSRIPERRAVLAPFPDAS